MWLVILKWICFIITCTDTLAFIINKPTEVIKKDLKWKLHTLIGFSCGIAARVFVLYGILTCWLLA